MNRRIKELAKATAAVIPFPGKTELIKPWSKDKRAIIQDKIDEAAIAAARRLKAKCCVVIAFFDDGAYIHMQDGGQSPMPTDQLYRHLVAAKEAMEASGGEDVVVQ